MKMKEMVEKTISTNEDLFSRVDQKLAVKIIRAFLKNIKNEIENIDEGRISLQGLGNVVIKKRTLNKQGEDISVKNIILRLQKKEK